MIKRILALVLGLALTPVLASPEAGYRTFTASSTATTVTVNAPSLVIINDSTPDSIFVRVFWVGETAADATTSNTEIKSGGNGLQFQKQLSLASASIVCASTKTAVVRLIWFYEDTMPCKSKGSKKMYGKKGKK